MVLVHRPFVFLVVAALGGMGWTLSASELWWLVNAQCLTGPEDG
jgi:hypothetical protein